MKARKIIFSMLVLLFEAAILLAQSGDSKPQVYLVSNAHFDTQWNWDVQKSISEYIPKTLDQNLFLLGKYPDYIFNFEGGIKYAWMKEYYPYQYELIKKYVKNGRWHITGSTWDATDANVPSPESFTRNILYGQQYYRDEFGVQGTDIFLPDCFGFGWTLPTIAAHSGLIGFSTQKLQWREKPFYGNSKIPFEIGLWQGIDGSRIMLVADAYSYGTRWKNEDLSRNPRLIELASKSPLNTVYHYYGTGDTGGAPTIESVCAVEKGVKGQGELKIISATSDQLYKNYLPFDKHPELPVFTGELLMDVHGTGCYTSQAAMKLYNRRNELLADASERSAVMADWSGGMAYPKGTLTEAWKRFIWHQFHDDLTGTSIPRAYEFSWNDELISMKQFANVLTSAAGTVARAMDTQTKGAPLLIYNPHTFPVSELIEVQIPSGKPGAAYTVYNEKGEVIPSQILSTEKEQVRLLVSASAPACGYVVYDVRTGSSKPANALKVTDTTLENSIYKLTLDANGDIASIVDKRGNKELVKTGKSVRLALFTENESFNWPAWEILKKTIDQTPVSVTGNVTISIAEKGPLRAALCVERTYGESVFKQYIRLSEGEQNDRIDIFNEIHWQTTNALLKAEFPLNVSHPKAMYDLGVGSVERGNNTDTAYEVYAQQWADLTDRDQSYGVSILNDCKYGWDKPDDNTLRLTLLHTPKTRRGYAYQDKQDFGKHIFTYSIVGHTGTYKDAGIVRKADVLNQSLVAFLPEKHKGIWGKSFSFLRTDNRNVVVKALKQAEKSDEYIVRLYETSGTSAQSATLTFAGDILAAKELNGVEDEKGEVSFKGKELSFEIKPFGMKTFKVRLSAPAQSLETIQSVPLSLSCNLKTASFNAFWKDVNFDGKGNAYAAELLPETIDFKGVRFNLASAEGANAVRCQGDTISLPQGNFNRLYLLAVSSQKDRKVTFMVDKMPQKKVVPAYSGFIGQWGHTGHTEGYLKSTDVAFVGTHRHSQLYNKDLPYEFTYMFAIPLDIPKNARQLVLPENKNIIVFAATLVNDANNALVPAVDLLNVRLPDTEAIEEYSAKKDLLFGKKIIDKSGEVNARQKAEFAINGDVEDKWCDTGTADPKYITVDLEKEENIRGWFVLHAGLEDPDYITREYALQTKINENEAWKTVDTVSENTQPETDRLLTQPVKARYIRLNITKPEQNGGTVVRIYDFQVY